MRGSSVQPKKICVQPTYLSRSMMGSRLLLNSCVVWPALFTKGCVEELH